MASNDELGRSVDEFIKSFGKGSSAVKGTMDELVKTFKEMNKTAALAEKSIAKFEEAAGEATNTMQDEVAKGLKTTIKNLDLLDDESLKHIKNVKQLTATMSKFEGKAHDAEEVLSEYNEALRAAGKDEEKRKKIHDRFNDKLAAVNVALGISTEKYKDNIDASTAYVRKVKDLTKEVDKGTKTLSGPSARVGKALDDLKGQTVGAIEKLGKFSVVLGLVTNAAKELYDQATRLSNRGMLMAMKAINIQALKLRMSVEEFETIINANMDVIQALGGGVDGINAFGDKIKEASAGLELMGKEGEKFAARMMGTLTRSGIGAGAKDPAMAATAVKTQKELNKQFRFFSGAFGDTAEQFTDYYGTVLQTETMQAKINQLDAKGVDLMMKEIMTRTTNLRLMGLNNEQVAEMTKTLNTLYDPNKNKQAEAITEMINAQNAVVSMANETKDAQLQETLRSDKMARFVEAMYSADPNEQANLIASNPDLVQALAKANQERIETRGKTGGAMSFHGIATTEFMQGAGGLFQQMLKTGGQAVTADRAGLAKKGDINDPTSEAGKFKAAIDSMSGDTSKLGQAFGKLREIIEQVTALFKNPFTAAITAALGTALFFSSTLRGALVTFVKQIFGVLSGTAGSIKGLFTGLVNGLKKLPVIGAAIAGIEGAWEGLNTETEDYYKRLGIDPKEAGGEGAMGVAKDLGVRTVGVLSDVGSAAVRGVTFGMYDPSKNFADKQTKTATPSTAPTATKAPASAPTPDKQTKTATPSTATPSTAPTATKAPASAPTPGVSDQRQKLLDFIGKHESGGSYNKLVGGKEIPLEQMTIAEVLAQQAQMNQKGSGFASSAVGKYQVIRATLLEAISALGLDPNTTKFDKATQDKIGNYLLDRRGAKQFESGQMSGDKFMTNISKEWASMPKDASGRGYYDGFNGNRSGTSYAQLSSAVSGMSGGTSTSMVTPPSVNSPEVLARAETAQAAQPAGATMTAPPVLNETLSENKKQTSILASIASYLSTSGGASSGVYQQDRHTAAAAS